MNVTASTSTPQTTPPPAVAAKPGRDADNAAGKVDTKAAAAATVHHNRKAKHRPQAAPAAAPAPAPARASGQGDKIDVRA